MKTEILLNGKYLELIDDVSMPLTYQIADIKDPSKKNTNFSKTITLPGTAINNKIFGFIWDTNVTINSSGTTNFTPSFNPNKKADVQILYDGAEVFKGFMKLDRIKVLSDYKIEYDVTCFGKLKDLFLELGEKSLADLDLSKYNHKYTKDVQQASWDNYIYKNGVTVPFSKGDGYVYPMIDYAINNNIDWKTEHFFPAVYYKTMIHEIITQAGFKYDGTIFNDSDFKSLVVTYGSGNLKLSNSQIDNRTFQASKILDTSYLYLSANNPSLPPYGNIGFDDDYTSPNNDAGNTWDIINSKYTAPVNGFYKFTGNLNFNLQHFPSVASVTPNQSSIQIGRYLLYVNGNVVQNWIIAFETVIYTNTPYIEDVNGIYTIRYGTSPITSGSISPTFNFILSQQLQLNKNDIVELKWITSNGVSQTGSVYKNIYNETPSITTSWCKMKILSGSSFKNEMASVQVMEGDTVDMSNLFNNTIKQKDFVSSFFKLFNIYTETDKYDSNLLHFETRPDFYQSSGTIRNWDNKLDYSQNYEITPMGSLDARTYLFKFKDDTDYWNDYYKKKYQETYGQRKYTVDNDWLSNTNTTEVIFSPTPLVDRPNDDKIIPRIIGVNNTGQAVPLSTNGNKAVNLRLLYYGGVKTTNTSYNYITSSGSTLMSNYAYAGHLNDLNNPGFDVNYYVPIEVYYTTQAYTNNNLFNKYYKQFIDEITNKDSKIFKGQFHLTAIDIAKLNFRDLFYFHGDYWVLNKIYDYNPIEVNKTTTCEFIKFKGGVPFVPTSGTTKGGTGKQLDSITNFPAKYSSLPVNGNIFDGNILISGKNNIVNSSVQDALIIGSDNSISGGAQRVSLINSSGTVISGDVQNVMLINSNDLVIDSTYNGKTVIDGAIANQKQIIWSSGTYTFDGTESGALALFEITASTNSYLPYPSQIQNGYNIKIKNANNTYALTIYIQSDSITPIWSNGDGNTATSLRMSVKEYLNFTYYNGVWYIN